MQPHVRQANRRVTNNLSPTERRQRVAGTGGEVFQYAWSMETGDVKYGFGGSHLENGEKHLDLGHRNRCPKLIDFDMAHFTYVRPTSKDPPRAFVCETDKTLAAGFSVPSLYVLCKLQGRCSGSLIWRKMDVFHTVPTAHTGSPRRDVGTDSFRSRAHILDRFTTPPLETIHV